MVVGRISAIVNVGHNERYHEKRGFFGSSNRSTIRRYLGGFSTRLLSGCESRDDRHTRSSQSFLEPRYRLFDRGFDTPPTFMMAHNLPYYEKLILDSGFAKCQDVYAFEGDISMLDNLDPKLYFVSKKSNDDLILWPGLSIERSLTKSSHVS